jgi:hypothetical protein
MITGRGTMSGVSMLSRVPRSKGEAGTECVSLLIKVVIVGKVLLFEQVVLPRGE